MRECVKELLHLLEPKIQDPGSSNPYREHHHRPHNVKATATSTLKPQHSHSVLKIVLDFPL